MDKPSLVEIEMLAIELYKQMHPSAVWTAETLIRRTVYRRTARIMLNEAARETGLEHYA